MIKNVSLAFAAPRSMGTRQLQKLQGKDLLLGQDDNDSEAVESGDGGDAAPAFNPFLLLGDEVLHTGLHCSFRNTHPTVAV